MSAQPDPVARHSSATDAVGGLLGSLAIFIGVIAIFYRPARVAPAAILLALVSAGLSRNWSRLALVGLIFAAVGWLAGMSIAVATNHPIW